MKSTNLNRLESEINNYALQDSSSKNLLKNSEGRIGYIILWLLGVPASFLFLIFIIRGG